MHHVSRVSWTSQGHHHRPVSFLSDLPFEPTFQTRTVSFSTSRLGPGKTNMGIPPWACGRLEEVLMGKVAHKTSFGRNRCDFMVSS